ncbi:hypothetical protein HK097_006537, partial [Rhizophlyctis rosea]
MSDVNHATPDILTVAGIEAIHQQPLLGTNSGEWLTGSPQMDEVSSPFEDMMRDIFGGGTGVEREAERDVEDDVEMREVGAGDGAGTDVEGDVEIREAGEDGVNVAEGGDDGENVAKCGDDGGKKDVATNFGDDLPMSADFTGPQWEVDYTPDTWGEIYWDLTKLSDPLRNITKPLKLTKPPSKTELKKFITENYNPQRQHEFLDLLEQKLLGTGRRDGLDDMIQKMASLGLADLEKERDLESLQIENA